MIAGLDVDGIFADFTTAFTEHCVKCTGRDLFPPRPFDVPTWDYPQHFGYTPQEMDPEKGIVWRAIRDDPEWWSFVPPFADADESLQRLKTLSADHEIVFVSNRKGRKAWRQTKEWIETHGYDNPTVILSARKAAIAMAIGMDLYIDDRFATALDVANTRTKSYLLTRPWNTRPLDRTADPKDVGIIEVTTVGAFIDAIR